MLCQPAFSDWESRIAQLVSNLENSERRGSDIYIFGPNVLAESCRSYPHYSIVDSENRDGHLQLQQDLIQAVSQGLSCMIDPDNRFAEIHRERALRLLTLLEDAATQKTFSCVPGLDQQAPAYSNYENFDRESVGFMFVSDLIPNFPGMLLDTNALAGNHRLHIQPGIAPWQEIHPAFEERSRERLSNRGTPKENSLPYQATGMLLFHEMLHWVDYKHAEHYPMDDIILLQGACFGQNIHSLEVSEEAIERSKTILQDLDYWSHSHSERPLQASQKNFHIDAYDIRYDIYRAARVIPGQEELPARWGTQSFDGFFLYGPQEQFQFVQQVIAEMEQSPLHRSLILDPLRNRKTSLFVGPEKQGDDSRSAVLSFAAFSALSTTLRLEQVYNGREQREDFAKTLRYAEKLANMYFGSRTGLETYFPDQTDVDTWKVGLFFDPSDERLDPLAIEGRHYNLREHLIIRLWVISQMVHEDHTQIDASDYPRAILNL
jgi:hypothetical protein